MQQYPPSRTNSGSVKSDPGTSPPTHTHTSTTTTTTHSHHEWKGRERKRKERMRKRKERKGREGKGREREGSTYVTFSPSDGTLTTAPFVSIAPHHMCPLFFVWKQIGVAGFHHNAHWNLNGIATFVCIICIYTYMCIYIYILYIYIYTHIYIYSVL